MNNKPIYVTFGDKKIESEFEILKEGKFEDKQLYEFIERAIKDLKSNPTCGTKISKKLWLAYFLLNEVKLANLQNVTFLNNNIKNSSSWKLKAVL